MIAVVPGDDAGRVLGRLLDIQPDSASRFNRRQTLPARRRGSSLPRPVGPEYSYSLRKIDMMKAVNGWEFHNVARFRCS